MNTPKDIMDRFREERRDSLGNNDLPVAMHVYSRVPSKYRLVDLETGDVWKFDVEQERWVAVNDIEVNYSGTVGTRHL